MDGLVNCPRPKRAFVSSEYLLKLQGELARSPGAEIQCSNDAPVPPPPYQGMLFGVPLFLDEHMDQGVRFVTNYIRNTASIVFDRRTDAHPYGTNILLIRIREPRSDLDLAARYTREIAPGWIVDFDEDGPIEIEVLNPAAHFPADILGILPLEFLVDEQPAH